ncbi:LBF_1199 family protein [Leptospira ryugenii]|nr:hypothetical protein [Leptospira ryugenii]
MNILIWDFWKKAGPNNAKASLSFLSDTDLLQDYLEILFEVEELRDYFIRYLWILRNEPEIETLINRKDLPVPLLLNFLYHGFGKTIAERNAESSEYILELVSKLSSAQSLRILLDHTGQLNDPTLKIFLITNLDAVSWEAFFSSLEQEGGVIEGLVELFSEMDQKTIDQVFFTNPQLYQYVRMVIVLCDNDNPIHMEFSQKIEPVFVKLEKWDKFTKQMAEFFPYEVEKQLKLQERNPNRLSILLHELNALESEYQSSVVEYLFHQHIIVDREEKNILTSALKNYQENKKFFLF